MNQATVTAILTKDGFDAEFCRKAWNYLCGFRLEQLKKSGWLRLVLDNEYLIRQLP